MQRQSIIGLCLIFYGMTVLYIDVVKPISLWDRKKIRIVVKLLGEKGTEMFFHIFGWIITLLGIFLMLR